MAELEDMINSVLKDPEQMNMIAGLARSLMGEEEPKIESAPEEDMLKTLRSMMSGKGREPSKPEALLRAMQPFLSEKRRGKMDKALKLARMAKLAGFALEQMGGGEND